MCPRLWCPALQEPGMSGKENRPSPAGGRGEGGSRGKCVRWRAGVLATQCLIGQHMGEGTPSSAEGRASTGAFSSRWPRPLPLNCGLSDATGLGVWRGRRLPVEPSVPTVQGPTMTSDFCRHQPPDKSSDPEALTHFPPGVPRSCGPRNRTPGLQGPLSLPLPCGPAQRAKEVTEEA